MVRYRDSFTFFSFTPLHDMLILLYIISNWIEYLNISISFMTFFLHYTYMQAGHMEENMNIFQPLYSGTNIPTTYNI
jgi:hypothetical protein